MPLEQQRRDSCHGATRDPMQRAVRDALIAFMAATSQAQSEVTKGRSGPAPRPRLASCASDMTMPAHLSTRQPFRHDGEAFGGVFLRVPS
jgi:hypothetical protein